jgi:hypothetical protein
MLLLTQKSARYLILALPFLSLLVSIWGTTWGWNTDGMLFQEAPYYLVVSVLFFALPGYLLLGLSKGRLAPLGRLLAGVGRTQLFLGLYTILAALCLISLFGSGALWLGSMSVFYVGFGISALGVIRILA